MSKKEELKSFLNLISNAIRLKTSSTQLIKPVDFPQKILDIPQGQTPAIVKLIIDLRDPEDNNSPLLWLRDGEPFHLYITLILLELEGGTGYDEEKLAYDLEFNLDNCLIDFYLSSDQFVDKEENTINSYYNNFVLIPQKLLEEYSELSFNNPLSNLLCSSYDSWGNIKFSASKDISSQLEEVSWEDIGEIITRCLYNRNYDSIDVDWGLSFKIVYEQYIL